MLLTIKPLLPVSLGPWAPVTEFLCSQYNIPSSCAHVNLASKSPRLAQAKQTQEAAARHNNHPHDKEWVAEGGWCKWVVGGGEEGEWWVVPLCCPPIVAIVALLQHSAWGVGKTKLPITVMCVYPCAYC